MSGSATHQIAVLAAIGDRAVSLDELAEALPIERKAIVKASMKLITRSFLEREEAGVYRLTEAGLAALRSGEPLRSGPHRGRRKIPLYRDTLSQRAWAAMRLQARFTLGDLVTLAARASDKQPMQSLQRFVWRLTAAGYLAQLASRVPGVAETSPGHRQWRLIRDTGEHAPRWIEKQRAFRDWNTREIFALQPVGEDRT